MVSLVAKFDGQKIEVPDELRGAAPGDVLITYPASDPVDTSRSDNRPTFRDFFGKAGINRTANEIIDQVRQERDAWNDE